MLVDGGVLVASECTEATCCENRFVAVDNCVIVDRLLRFQRIC